MRPLWDFTHSPQIGGQPPILALSNIASILSSYSYFGTTWGPVWACSGTALGPRGGIFETTWGLYTSLKLVAVYSLSNLLSLPDPHHVATYRINKIFGDKIDPSFRSLGDNIGTTKGPFKAHCGTFPGPLYDFLGTTLVFNSCNLTPSHTDTNRTNTICQTLFLF